MRRIRTPRNTVKAFCQMLSVIEQNPGTDWRSLLGSVEVAPDVPESDDIADELDPGQVGATGPSSGKPRGG